MPRKAKTTIKSEAAIAHGRNVIASLARDPATGKLLPKVPPAAAAAANGDEGRLLKKIPTKRPAARPVPAPKPASVPPRDSSGGGTPVPDPFRGRLLRRLRSRSR